MVGGSDAQERIRIGYFGDVRRDQAGAILLERVVATGSLVVHKIGGVRTGELSAHRFLGSGHVLCCFKDAIGADGRPAMI
jgi:hypothetical protein